MRRDLLGEERSFRWGEIFEVRRYLGSFDRLGGDSEGRVGEY